MKTQKIVFGIIATLLIISTVVSIYKLPSAIAYDYETTIASTEIINFRTWTPTEMNIFLDANGSGTWVNRTAVPIFSPHTTLNDYVILPNANVTFSYKFYANDSIGQYNVTSIFSFVVSMSTPYEETTNILDVISLYLPSILVLSMLNILLTTIVGFTRRRK